MAFGDMFWECLVGSAHRSVLLAPLTCMSCLVDQPLALRVTHQQGLKPKTSEVPLFEPLAEEMTVGWAFCQRSLLVMGKPEIDVQ